MHNAVHDTAPATPATAVAGRLRAVGKQLRDVSELLRSLLEHASAQAERPTRADLAQLTDRLRDALSRPERSVDGIGVAMTTGYLADSDYWLEWWRADRANRLEFVAHALNPQQDAFYDYPARTWFTAPIAADSPVATGPYVDSGGTNAYTVTVAMPVRIAGLVAAVAGADIYVTRFESDLITAATQQPVVLTNAARRVIASTTPAYLPGDLLAAELTAPWHAQPIQEAATDSAAWHLFTLPE